MTTNPDKLMPAAISRCVAHWIGQNRTGPIHKAEALLSAIEMAYAEGLESATPPKGHVLDDTGTLRRVLEWSINPLTGRIHAEIEAESARQEEPQQ